MGLLLGLCVPVGLLLGDSQGWLQGPGNVAVLPIRQNLLVLSDSIESGLA